MVSLSAPRRYRLALVAVLAVALLAALYAAVRRERVELASRHVEIAMDYGDFASLCASYGYDRRNLLVALRRAGLTSLAVSEELGGNVNSGTAAVAVSGPSLVAQSRIGAITQPTLARLARTGGLRADEVYLVVYDPAALARYRGALAESLGAGAVRTLRTGVPTVLGVRTQIDSFGSIGLGLPETPLALARELGLYLVPRVQNDERFDGPRIARIFAGVRKGERPSTVVFFGARNEVLGYPDHLEDAAYQFRRTGLNFGAIEAYDKLQVQKGTDELGKLAIARTTRVEAISKTELDKLDFDTVVARYLLGVRERNVRVAYLRPFLHEQGGMSLERTNVELVRQIADGLRARGFSLGRATPVPAFRINPVVVALISLAVPAIVALLFEAFGIRRPQLAYALFAADLAILAAGYGVHHDLLARKLLALAAAIAFSAMAVVAVPRSFTLPAPGTYGACFLAGLRTFGVAIAFALMGALVVVGLASAPLLMEEIDRFAGVKAVIVLPPLLAFCFYAFSRRFGVEPPPVRESANAPVRVYQLAAVAALAALAFVYISRSGNQSDIAPSAFELALRSHLTAALGVRPRFKLFAIGVPLMMLLPALRLEHKRAVGWLFAIGIAVGSSDVVDTFSHLHTPLVASLTRVVNGAVLGVLVGALVIRLYRAIDARFAAAALRRRVRTL